MTRPLFLLLLVACAACSNAEATQEQQVVVTPALAAHRLARPDGPVLDAANLIEPAEEQRLEDRLIGFNHRTGHALVVVTVPTLGGEDIADYTLELFNRWGVGGEAEGDGIVLLVAPHDRQVRIATGYGMEEKVPDALCAQIIRDTIIPHFRKGAMADGIDDGVEALSAAMTAG